MNQAVLKEVTNDHELVIQGNSLVLNAVSFKYSNGFSANENISLTLTHGIIGLLGPNGAGKTTLMKMLATVNKPTAGDISWNGHSILKNPNALRDELGYLPQDFGVYPSLSAKEFLRYIAVIKGLTFNNVNQRVDECIDMVGLAEKADMPMAGYSGGMKQRVGIAQALLNDPKLLIVDEPTVGLDPEERLRFRHLLTDLAASRVIILSTHIVSDIEASASRLCVLHKGKLAFDNTPEKMIEEAKGKVWELLVDSFELASIKSTHKISTSTRRAEGVMVRIVSAQQPAKEAVQVTPNLEDAYVWFLAQQEG